MKRNVTKDINIVKCLHSISISVILDNAIVEKSEFTFISTINHSGNLNNLGYTTFVKNNFSGPWCHCNDAAVISGKYLKGSTSKKVLENNTSYTLLYEAF